MRKQKSCCWFSKVGELFSLLDYVSVSYGSFASGTDVLFRFPLLELFDEAYASFPCVDDWTY
jgi:hypothetical protein